MLPAACACGKDDFAQFCTRRRRLMTARVMAVNKGTWPLVVASMARQALR
jgi:hypothetical protein